MIKVAALTPTMEGREDYLKRCKKIVQSQNYKNIQHIIIPGDGTIGAKLNLAIQSSSAEIFVRIDDDDLYANDYISRCVETLKDCDTTGLSLAYFTDGNRAWLWEWKGGQKLVCGSGMAFWRRVWENNKFKHVNSGEDTIFCSNAGKIVPHGYLNGFIATIHEKNTASHHAIPFMKEVDINLIPKLEAFQ